MGRRCIICCQKKDVDEFNIEHVIPDSSGGDYKINNVCKDCNNLLGNTVDYDFLKNPLIKLLLICYDIRNKKGKLPRLFKKDLVSEDFQIKGSPIYNDRNGKLERVQYKTVAESTDDKFHFKYDSLESIEDVLSECDIDEQYKQKIRDKFYAGEYTDEHIPFKQEYDVNLVPLIIESCKIAYESACDVFKEDYLEDEIGKNIRKLLNDPNLFDEMKFKEIPLLNFQIKKVPIGENVKHYIFLAKTKKHILAHVMLLNYIETTLVISDNVDLFKNNVEMSIIIDYWDKEEVLIKHLKDSDLPDDGIDLTSLNLFH